ncbi:hypothetical protein [Micromonospora luteifusca]|uniref:hypothetical protein n=1 Tax=Micromonospora luteifusca TaxID=709860 RepID=UPI0033AAB804
MVVVNAARGRPHLRLGLVPPTSARGALLWIRVDADVRRITEHFFARNLPIALVCHGAVPEVTGVVAVSTMGAPGAPLSAELDAVWAAPAGPLGPLGIILLSGIAVAVTRLRPDLTSGAATLVLALVAALDARRGRRRPTEQPAPTL